VVVDSDDHSEDDSDGSDSFISIETMLIDMVIVIKVIIMKNNNHDDSDDDEEIHFIHKSFI